MSPFVKAMLALALVVPLVAYVAGSLASTGGGTPDHQGTVYINEADPAPVDSSADPFPRSSPTSTPSPARPMRSPRRDNQPTKAPSTDDEEARVVTPTPVEDEDDEGDDDQDDDRDDDRDDTDDGDETDD